MKKITSSLAVGGVALACAGVLAAAGAPSAQAATTMDYAELPHASIGFKVGSYYLMDTDNLTPKSASAKKANAKYRIAYRKGSMRGDYRFAPLPAKGFGKGGSVFSNGKRMYYLYGDRVYGWKLGTKKATKSKKLEKGSAKLEIVAVADGGVYLSRQASSNSRSVYRYDVKTKKFKRVLSGATVLSASGDQIVAGKRSSVAVRDVRSGNYDDNAYRDVTVYEVRGTKLHKVEKLADLARSNNKTDGYDRLVKKKLKGYQAHYYEPKASLKSFKYAKVSDKGKVGKSRTYRF